MSVKLKLGKKYITRCGTYVFKTVGQIGNALRTVCVKELKPHEGGEIHFFVGEETSHYSDHGNWMLDRTQPKSCDLVARYRKPKPAPEEEGEQV